MKSRTFYTCFLGAAWPFASGSVHEGPHSGCPPFYFLPSTQDVLLQGLAQERVSRQALYLSFGVSGSHLLTHWESEGFAIDLQAPTTRIVFNYTRRGIDRLLQYVPN